MENGSSAGEQEQEPPMNSEEKNYAEIARLEALLKDVRATATTARETEAIREVGLEIAIAVREVGAMLINVGWEQSFAAERSQTKGAAGAERGRST
jgi:hypothetical protein